MIDRQQMLAEGTELLYREGAYLDQQRWDDWLELFSEDCEYQVPSWKNEQEYTLDPTKEVSLIYYKTRHGLEDRVWRIRSGQSVASRPVPRTTHAVHNVLLDEATDKTMDLSSSWNVHCFFHKPKKSDVFFGRSQYRLVNTDKGWRIKKRLAILMNDYIPTMLDVYNI